MSFSDYQLLCASSMAYEIQDNGTFTPPTSGEKGDEYGAIGTILDTKVIKSRQAACLLLNTSSGIIVAYRGTLSDGLDCATMDDWLTNVRFVFTDWNGMKVHTGFADECDTLFSGAIRQVEDWGNKPLFVTGHSQGGGVAILSAYQFQNRGKSIQNVVVFAAPNVGSQDFADRYNSYLRNKTTAYQHAGDFVPMLPPNRAQVPYPMTQAVEEFVKYIMEHITKSKESKGLQISPCISLTMRILNLSVEIYKAFSDGTVSEKLADVAKYYAVGGTKFIKFDNSIVGNVSYFTQLQDLGLACIDNKGGGPVECHALSASYGPAVKQLVGV